MRMGIWEVDLQSDNDVKFTGIILQCAFKTILLNRRPYALSIIDQTIGKK